MIRRPPRSTRTDTLFPYTTLFRSLPELQQVVGGRQLALAPKTLKQVLAALNVGASTGLPARPRGLCCHVAFDGAAAIGIKFDADSVRFGHCEIGIGNRRDNRSEERRVGKECVSTCRSRWSRYN